MISGFNYNTNTEEQEHSSNYYEAKDKLRRMINRKTRKPLQYLTKFILSAIIAGTVYLSYEVYNANQENRHFFVKEWTDNGLSYKINISKGEIDIFNKNEHLHYSVINKNLEYLLDSPNKLSKNLIDLNLDSLYTATHEELRNKYNDMVPPYIEFTKPNTDEKPLSRPSDILAPFGRYLL